MPMSEVATYRKRLDESVEKAGKPFDGTWAVMRHSAIYETEEDRANAISSVRHVLGQFGNLMMKKGDVINGFPEEVPLEELDGNARVDPEMLEENLMFGTPEQVTEKLCAYRDHGADAFIYYASLGLDMAQQKRSLQLFIDKVMPNFQTRGLAETG